MTRGELLDFLTRQAKEFRNDKTSISRNYHLTDIKEQPEQHLIDGILVAFINHIGVSQCIDYALSVEDLDK
jgi:hypothetical protein